MSAISNDDQFQKGKRIRAHLRLIRSDQSIGHEERFLRMRLVIAAKSSGVRSLEYLIGLTELFPFVRAKRRSTAQVKRYLEYTTDLLQEVSPHDAATAVYLLKQVAWFAEGSGFYLLAERSYLRALTLLPLARNLEERPRILKGLSALYFKSGRQAEALIRAQEAFDLSQEGFVGSLRDRAEIVAHLGSLLGAVGQPHDGILYLVSALTLTESGDVTFKNLQADIADRIAEIAESLGEQERAFAYSRLSRSVRSKLYKGIQD